MKLRVKLLNQPRMMVDYCELIIRCVKLLHSKGQLFMFNPRVVLFSYVWLVYKPEALPQRDSQMFRLMVSMTSLKFDEYKELVQLSWERRDYPLFMYAVKRHLNLACKIHTQLPPPIKLPKKISRPSKPWY